MDNLARNAMLARQDGVSYGKWKAMQPIVKVEPEKDEIPEGWKRCEVCGKPFKKNGQKLYCDLACREKKRNQRRRERSK